MAIECSCSNWYLDSIAAISKRFALSESKVKTMLFRSRNALRKYLERGERWIFLLQDELSDAYWCNGDSDGKYPLPDEDIMALLQDYQFAVDALSALLMEQGMVSAEVCAEIEENDGCVYGDDSGGCYVIFEEDEEKFYALIEDKRSVQDRVDEQKFGVYDGEMVKLQIYWDILHVYNLSLK